MALARFVMKIMRKLPQKPGTLDDIFKSDGEPNQIDSDLLVEMLTQAAEQNKRRVTNYQAQVTIWEMKYYRKLVQFVFNLVNYLNIDEPFVRYNTCDLFEKFQQNHINLFKEDLLDEQFRAKTLYDMKDQALLRLISCIMLSTKVSSVHQIKDLRSYALTMNKFDKVYKKITIVRSEEYVMHVVGYIIDHCPVFSICPLLILTLVYNEPSIDGKLLFSTLNKTLDHYYLAKGEIMMKLFDELKKIKEISFDEFKCYIADSMLIGCAIVSVLPMMVYEQSGSKILEELVYITSYPLRDIELIRNVIWKGIQDDMKTQQINASTN